MSREGADVTRSRRKTPIAAVSAAPSDKPFKIREHRKERRAVAEAIRNQGEMPSGRAFGDPWNGKKDGKSYVHNDDPSLRRK